MAVDGQRDFVGWAFPPRIHEGWCGNDEMEQVRQMVLAQPLVPGEDFTAEQVAALVHRAANNAYLGFSHALGLFKGREGQELLTRVRANDPHSHRGAMAECIAAWWLGSVLRFNLVPRPKGIGKKVLEFEIRDQSSVGVEVKAPYRPARYTSGQVFSKDPMDTDHMGAVVTCLGDAHQKFDPQRVNLVVLVPSLDWSPLPAVIRALEERRGLAIDAVMIISSMQDWINPTARRAGEAFLTHRCCVVRNRHRRPPKDSFWRGWPVYEGPDFEIWKKLKPVYGNQKRRWVRASSAPFTGKHIVFVPVQ